MNNCFLEKRPLKLAMTIRHVRNTSVENKRCSSSSKVPTANTQSKGSVLCVPPPKHNAAGLHATKFTKVYEPKLAFLKFV